MREKKTLMIFFLLIYLFLICECFACLYVYALCTCTSCRSQRRISDPLELDLQKVVSHQVDAGIEPTTSERAVSQ